MAPTLKATVKLTKDWKGWYIEIYNPESDEKFECKDVDSFEETMMQISTKYSDPIEKVDWVCEENVHPAMLDNLRSKIQAMQEKYMKSEK